MSYNKVKIRRGSGIPDTNDLVTYELGYDYANNKLYIHDGDSGSIVEIGGSTITSVTGMNNNNVLTASGSTTISGEGSLTFDGSTLGVTGQIDFTSELNFTGAGNKIIDVETLAGSNSLTIRHHNPSGNLFEDALKLTANAGAKLYYNNGLRLETTDAGVNVAGKLDADGVGKFRGDNSEGKFLELGQLSYNAAVGAINLSYFDDTSGGSSLLKSGDHLEIHGGRWGSTTTITRGGQGGNVPVASLYGSGSHSWLELYQPTSPTDSQAYTTKVRLRADGASYFTNNLGIGTTSPSVKLHVNDNNVLIGNNSSGYATLSFHNEGTGSGRYASIMKNYDSPFDMRIRASNSTSEMPLVFDGSNDTEYARFDTSGRFGIGTTSPNTKFHISDTSSNNLVSMKVQNSLGTAEFGAQSGYARIYSGGTLLHAHGPSIHYHYIGGNAVMALNGNGLGIGTVSPGAKLHVVHNGSAVVKAESTAGGYGAYSRLTTTTNSYSLVSLNGDFLIDEDAVATRFIIKDSTGNIGIGTASPSYKLDVHGVGRIYSASGDADLRIEGGASNTTSFLLRNGAGNNRVDFMIGGANAMTINSSRNVGIGTTSINGKLTVRDDTAGSPTRLTISNGGTAQSGTASRLSFYEGQTEKSYIERRRNGSGDTAFVTPADDNPFVFENATGEFLTLTNSRVGIRTNNPEMDLHINTTDDGSVMFTRNGGSKWSIEHDTSQLYFYNRTINKPAFLMSHAGTMTFNNGNSSAMDVHIKGTSNNLFFADASTNRIGIGTDSPAVPLTVQGSSGFQTDIRHDASTRLRISVESSGKSRLYTDNNSLVGLENGAYVQPTKKLHLDGGLDTYLIEESGNVMGFYCGNSRRMQLTTTYLQVPDNAYLAAGDNNEVFIRHDGNGHFQSNGGQMYINNVATTNIMISVGNDEKVRIENDGDLHVKADVVAFSSTPSDIRLKKNFNKIDNGLDVITKLDGQTFNWKKDEGRLSAGFKAQEVEQILPHLVDERELPLHSDDDKDYKVLRYEELIPYLVEAIKEQQVQINELKTKIGEQNG